VNVAMFLPVALTGLVGGLMGALFNTICLHGATFRAKFIKPHKRRFLCEPAVLALIYGSAIVLVPTLFGCVRGDCQGDSSLPGCERVGMSHVADTMAYGCPAGTYNPSATLFVRNGEHVITQLFARGFHYQFDYLSLCSLLLFYLPMSAYSNGVACSTGIVIPCLLNGALIGRLCGLVFIDLLPSSFGQGAEGSWLDPGAFALIGAAGFFSGVARLTFSLTVILIELSNDAHFILPIMVSILVAKWVADATGVHPIYHALMAKKKLPYLPVTPHVSLPLELFVAGQISTADVECVPLVVSLPALARLLLTTEHHAFPVTTTEGEKHGSSTEAGAGHFVGLVRREHLLSVAKSPNSWQRPRAKVLWGKIAAELNVGPSKFELRKLVSQLQSEELSVFDALQPVGIKSDSLQAELMALTDKSYDGYTVDLKPYVNSAALAIPENFPLSQTYELFRSMGLRHLTVVDRFNCVAGILTRHNLLEENLSELVKIKRCQPPKDIIGHYVYDDPISTPGHGHYCDAGEKGF